MKKLIALTIALVAIVASTGCTPSVRRGVNTAGEKTFEFTGLLVGKGLVRNDSTHVLDIQREVDVKTKKLRPRESYKEKFWGPGNEFEVIATCYKGGRHWGTVIVKYCGPFQNSTAESLILTDNFFGPHGPITRINHCGDPEPYVYDGDYSKRPPVSPPIQGSGIYNNSGRGGGSFGRGYGRGGFRRR